MEKSKLLVILSGDLDVFKSHLNRISKENYVVHELDKDLLLQKTRELYDKILQIDTSVKEKLVEQEKEVLPEKPSFKIEPQHKKTEEKQDLGWIDSDHEYHVEEPEDEEIEEIEEIVQEIVLPKVENVVIENNIIEEEILAVETKEEIEHQESVEFATYENSFDLFSVDNKETISDTFTANEEKSLADKLQESQISDLRQAIGINEKFLFINELFNGDMGRYNKSLDELNSMQSKAGIDTFLMELKIERQWNEEMDAFIKFKELIDRKFV